MKQLNRKSADILEERPVKVLQFGTGNFLRGFADWVIDILNEKTSFNGAVEILQVLDRGTFHGLNQQDGLFHVVLEGLQEGKPVQQNRLITCVKGSFNPYDDYQAYLSRGENPDLEIILSNTTEAGITFEAADTSMDTIPTSFPGKLTALLYRRFQHFNGDRNKGLTIIPCELIEKNGEKLRDTVLQYAAHWNLPQEFSDWVTQHNAFCNTLVDRIVPGFPKDKIGEIQQELGFEDNLVVKAEPFYLWVIEGPESVKKTFPTQEAGLLVKFADDLTPYRTSKVRILNGAHTTLVPVAYLQGLRTVREAVEDETTGKFLREAIFEEIIPTLDLPVEELEQFANDVLERFLNPFIRHELLSISLNSVSKYKVRVLPSVLEYVKRKEQLPERLLTSLAALILFYKGEWQEENIPLNDTPEVLAFFKEAWQQENVADTVHAVLSNESFWDQDLNKVPGLEELVLQQVRQFQSEEQLNQIKL